MKEIYKIYNVKYEQKFKNQISFLERLGIEEDVNILDILPEHMINSFLIHEEKLSNEIKTIDTKKYSKVLEKNISLLKNLSSAKVNALAYKAIKSVETNQTILRNLKDFRPYRGHSDIPKYSLTSNISGRMVIKKGPNILVLPKRCRTIFESSFSDGELISLDFVNLEPRIALKLTGKNPPVDIYEEAKNQLSFEIDRSVIKRAIITMLYGGSHESLKNISANKAVELFESMKKYFDMEELLNISSNIDDFGIRRNYFGRPIWNLDEAKSNILINNFIQSTAVDVALQYFSSLVDIVDNQRCKPIFLIHDAIVFDIQKDHVNEFNEIIKKGYDDKDLGNFPLSTSQFNKLCD